MAYMSYTTRAEKSKTTLQKANQIDLPTILFLLDLRFELASINRIKPTKSGENKECEDH